jgi:hypothetical protein
MGWIAITRKGELLREEDGLGRPVDAGNNGELIIVAQEDYGRSVAVDLINGIIAIDYESIGVQNGTIELANPKLMFWICDETNIVGELKHVEQIFTPAVAEDGSDSFVRTDILHDLQWRPIWFTRHTNTLLGSFQVKVIGAQVTLPEEYNGKNVKRLVSIFSDGRIGID